MILRKLTADPGVAQSATTGLVSGPAEKGLAEITIDPEEQKLYLQFRGGKAVPAEGDASLQPGETCHFIYIKEDLRASATKRKAQL